MVYISVADSPSVINRSAGPTVGIVYCQHIVVTKDGAINEHDRDAAVSIDAATLECSVMEAGTDGGRRTAAAVCQYCAEHSWRGKTDSIMTELH